MFMQKSNFPTAGEKAPMDKSGAVPFEATLPVLFCNAEITITTARSMASPRLPMMFAAHFPIVSAFHPIFHHRRSLSLSLYPRFSQENVSETMTLSGSWTDCAHNDDDDDDMLYVKYSVCPRELERIKVCATIIVFGKRELFTCRYA